MGDTVEVMYFDLDRWLRATVIDVGGPPCPGFDWRAGQAFGGRLLEDEGRGWRWPAGAVQSGEGEGLAPVGTAHVEGACSKQCHALTCPEIEVRHGCHDRNCIATFGPVGEVPSGREGEGFVGDRPAVLALQMCEGGCGTLANAGAMTCGRALCASVRDAREAREGEVPSGEVVRPAVPGSMAARKCRVYLGETAGGPVYCEATRASGTERCSQHQLEAAIRRCEAPGAEGELCGAGLGRDLQCNVCSGARCFGHCGGVDHRGGVLISQGGAGRVEWRLRALATREFAGQITVDELGSKAVVKSFLGRDPEEVKNRMLAHVDELIGAQDAITYATPAVRPLPAGHEKVAALLALVKLGQSAATREQDLLHTLERRRRAAVDAAADWYERATQAWEREAADPETNPRMVERCRALFEAQVTELFMRLGAAL